MRFDKSKFGIVSFVAIMAFVLVVCADNGAKSSSSSATTTPSGQASTSTASQAHKSTSTATQARQSPISTAAAMIGAIGSLVPSMISNVAPLVLLLGVGALMMPNLGLSAMSLLRESRRSANDAQGLPANGQFPPNLFAQYAARPLQTTPQDIYYFSKRSLPSVMSNFNSAQLVAGFQDLLERVVRAIDNADKRYN